MKRNIQVIALLIFLSTIETTAQTPTWLWANGAGGTDDDDSYGVCTDAAGNVFETGRYTSDSITFGSYNLFNASAGSMDIFVVKYDASGNVLWATSAGGTGDD